MSLWYQSLSLSCQNANNKSERIQEILRHLSMPVPQNWWQSCLENKVNIERCAEYLSEICEEILTLNNWNNYSLFVALAFTGLDNNTPLKYSIDSYYYNAKTVLKNQPEIKALGDKINILLQK